MTLGEGFKYAHLVAEKAENDDVSKAWRTHSHHGPRRVRTARGAKIFNQPIGTIITRKMIEDAVKAGKVRESQLSDVAPRTNAPGNGKNRVPNAPKVPGARAAKKVAAKAPAARAPKLPQTPQEHHKAYLGAIKNAQNIEDLGKIYDHLEANENKHFKGRPDLADSLFNQIARREASLETPQKAAAIRAHHGLTPKPAKKAAKKVPVKRAPAAKKVAAKKVAAPAPKSTHISPTRRRMVQDAVDNVRDNQHAGMVNRALADDRKNKKMGAKTHHSLALRLNAKVHDIAAANKRSDGKTPEKYKNDHVGSGTKRLQESNYNAMIDRANSANALSRVESLENKDYMDGWLHRRAHERIKAKIEDKRNHVAAPSDRPPSSYKKPERSIGSRTFQSARKQINRGTTGRASAAKRIEGLPEGRRKGLLQTELKLRNKAAAQRKQDASALRRRKAIEADARKHEHVEAINNAKNHDSLDRAVNNFGEARLRNNERLDLASLASKRRHELGPKTDMAALDAAHGDGYKSGSALSELKPPKGKGPRMLWMDVGQGFQDNGAIDAAVEEFAEKDAQVYVPKGLNGHRITLAVDRHNAKNPERRMNVVTFDGTDDQARVDEFIKQARKQNGRPNVVGFRDHNQTQGMVGDPVHRWLVADHSETPQAVIIHPGYQNKKDRNGDPVDSNGFVIGANDLPEEMAPDKPVKGDFTPEQVMRLNNAKKTRGDYAAYIRGIEKDPDNTPAGKELAKGVPIDQVKDPDGMQQYIRAHPEKFDVNVVGGGVSEAFSVRDKATGKLYFFKKTENNGQCGMYGDGINEYMAAKLGGAAFPGMFPDVDFGEKPEHGGNPLIRMQHMEEFVPNAKRVHYEAVNRQASEMKLAPAKDPRQPLAIHIFDYLINQKDRHQGNYGYAETPGGVVLIPIDNGAAFNGYGAYMERFDDMRQLPPGWASAPETIPYESWAAVMLHSGFNKGVRMQAETRAAYKAKMWGRDKAARDAEAIIQQYRSVDIDSIIADLLKRFPNMDKYERLHLEAAAAIWKSRLDMISADDVIRMLGL